MDQQSQAAALFIRPADPLIAATMRGDVAEVFAAFADTDAPPAPAPAQ